MYTKQHHLARALLAGSLVLVGGLGLAACGDDDDTVAQSGSLDSGSDGSMEDMSDDGHDDHETFHFGTPADAGDADRTVEVSMSDSLSYDPDTVDVGAGETILFEVTNEGKLTHEFVLGDHELQLDHEEEMAEMGGAMMMADEPNAIAVESGETKELAFTFTEPGELEFACHVPGHYDGGMVGDITVSE